MSSCGQLGEELAKGIQEALGNPDFDVYVQMEGGHGRVIVEYPFPDGHVASALTSFFHPHEQPADSTLAVSIAMDIAESFAQQLDLPGYLDDARMGAQAALSAIEMASTMG